MALCGALFANSARGAETSAELQNLTINGGIEDGKARLIIEAALRGMGGDREKLLFSTALQHAVQIAREKQMHTIAATFEILQGEAKELPLTISGEGAIKNVTGENLLDWSVRQETNGVRLLVIRPRKTEKQIGVTISAESETRLGAGAKPLLALAPPNPALLNGYLKLEVASELSAAPTNAVGVIPIEGRFLPDAMRKEIAAGEPEPLAFRFLGSSYSLSVVVATGDPEARRVTLKDFQLRGRVHGQNAEFVLTATAHVKNPAGGSITLLSGGVALDELEPGADWKLRFQNGAFVAVFDKAGVYPLRVKFSAAVKPEASWNNVDFRVAPGTIAPIVIEGLGKDTQFEFPNAAKVERAGEVFQSFLPADGAVRLSWKETAAEVEGKLFYAVEMLSQVGISPGLMRQTALLNGTVMQGELTRLALNVRGPGNVTAVTGPNVLSWKLEPGAGANERRILVQFNQPQKETFSLQAQMQTELGVFPVAVDVMQIRPEGATRFAGYVRVVNEGAVRLEILQATGLSQISPEQFPETEQSKTALAASGTQRFVYRFASPDFALRLQPDNILPEVSVSEILAYNLGETESSIDAEFELDIREAPVREVTLRAPKGYSIARIVADGHSDYFLTEPAGQPQAELRIVYGRPISDRQIIQLRLERNSALAEASWTLPRIEVTKARSTRGHIAVAADAGFRLTPERTSGLTDIATAFFPRKVAGIQAAFRITDAAWEAALRVERLPQSIQADVFHLFSIGEGIAYGSSTMNFSISGAPVSTFLVSLSDEYFNVEFTGKDLRNNWQKTTNGYVVTLNTPVSGAYTLLVTYERPFKAQGDTLTFTGARPVDAQSEQGHTIVVSAYQFQVRPANVSPGLLALETAEVPAEYRLFFDAPILAAYRYTARPFNLQLALSPLAQGETLALVVDRATLTTRISKEGEVLTDARYFVKNRGNPNLRITLPPGATLWSAMVNGATVSPVKDGDANLIRLPQRADANAVQTLDIKMASKSPTPTRVAVAAPIVAAPVLLAEWQINPDTGQRLEFRDGSLAPAALRADPSGFAQLARLLGGNSAASERLFFAIGMLLFALFAWRWAADPDAGGLQRTGGTLVGLAAIAFSALLFAQLNAWTAPEAVTAPGLSFRAPVQQSGSALRVEVENVENKTSSLAAIAHAWPAVFAIAVWIFAAFRGPGASRTAAIIAGWTLLAWAALRSPHGAGFFILVFGAFMIVQVIIPSIRAIFRPARIAAAVLLALSVLNSSAQTNRIAPPIAVTPMAESVTQEIRVDGEFVTANAKLRWNALKDQALPFLLEPAALTNVKYPTNAVRLTSSNLGNRRAHQLIAQQDGLVEIDFVYQIHTTKGGDGSSAFALPTQPGLVNRITLTLPELDVDVTSPNAVSIQRDAAQTNGTIARLTLAPATNSWISWSPRSRNARNEKAVFFAELRHLFAPGGGAIEAAHAVTIRPAQGEIGELSFDVPAGATITDVYGGNATEQSDLASNISVWRFDPDTRKLRATLSEARSVPFVIEVRSQFVTGPLPFEHTIGLLAINGASGQIGSVGIATGNDVQLDDVTVNRLSPINLEDFAPQAVEPLRAQIPDLSVRRAFRYADTSATLSLKASPVEPDVRVETQQTLSLGEDRVTLALAANVEITRAGIFRLSFALPAGLDVETISAAAMSHWTELKSAEGRIITMHLRAKTEGAQQFNISLTGAGIKSTNGYSVPRLTFREANKQQGQLSVVPEQGMRLQVGQRENATQLDPQKAGIRQKGVLAFRLLQPNWQLSLQVEQVNAWVQVTSLQHFNITEAQAKVSANLQYQIENTGLKALRILIPTNAEGVRFRGEQVADFLPVPGSATNAMEAWEVKLHRRIIGKYLLQANWQSPLATDSTNFVAQGIQALDANLQRGFVTVQSSGRLQLRAAAPDTLQPAEWQSIPRPLRQDIEASGANYTYRLVEPGYQMAIALERREATKLLPARVTSVDLKSAISDEGVMLTQARVELIPGDKQLLHFTLPPNARFWFAFVNQNGVWPWRDGDKILIPLEQQSQANKPTSVEMFYSSAIGNPATRKLDLTLVGPQFDLPLENITWQVYLNEKWRLDKWAGTLQLQENLLTAQPVELDATSYLSNERYLNVEKSKAAEAELRSANTLLQNGNPQLARRAFQNAFGLSAHDDAFNEDARVQLHNLKLQQALVGLNARQSSAPGTASENGPAPQNARDLLNRKEAAYTQQEAKQLIDANSADDNAALMKLAERLVQQQDAAIAAPTAIRATIPEQGRVLTFRRAVQVNTWTDLRVRIQAGASNAASYTLRIAMLLGVFAGFGALAWAARSIKARATSV